MTCEGSRRILWSVAADPGIFNTKQALKHILKQALTDIKVHNPVSWFPQRPEEEKGGDGWLVGGSCSGPYKNI